MKLSAWVLVAIAAQDAYCSDIFERGTCHANDCLRVVRGNYAWPNLASRRADCSKFQRATVTPGRRTATVTRTTTITTTLTPNIRIRDGELDERTYANRNAVPWYAKLVCRSPEAYASACSCIGIPEYTTVLATPTTTKTSKATATATVCPAPFTKCGTTCKRLSTDRDNCGGCGTQCPTDYTCEESVCQPPALQCGPQTNCGGTCIDTQTDNNNCGGCGQFCSQGFTCQAGTCTQETCDAGGGVQGGFCRGVCVDFQTNNRNCGMCGRDCGDGSVYTCDAGTCIQQPVCILPDSRIGFTCGGLCKDVRYDRDNCGACRNACPAGDICDNLRCSTPPTK
ncbi:hypothetical protein ONS96_013403 [Cadophora gregata f. sp. sojae]|nr:hypothetical protein ONS96_013403 [Cadophora gregata f. sp. sojae]